MKISRRIPPGTPSSHARKYLPIAFSLVGEMSVRAERAFRSWPACNLRRAPQLRADERVFPPVYAYLAASHVPHPVRCRLRASGLPAVQANKWGGPKSAPRGNASSWPSWLGQVPKWRRSRAAAVERRGVLSRQIQGHQRICRTSSAIDPPTPARSARWSCCGVGAPSWTCLHDGA